MHFDIRKIRHLKSIVEPALIDLLYNSAKNATDEPATVGKIVNGQYTTEYNKWCTAKFVDYSAFKSDVDKVIDICTEHVEKNFNVNCLQHEIHFLHYTDGTHYHSHIDGQYIKDDKALRGVDRDITCVVYLNDDYQGGEINFDFFKYTLKPNKADIVIYPTTFEFVHSVSKVVGDRYAIVLWFKTDPMMNVDVPIKDTSVIKFLQRITSV